MRCDVMAVRGVPDFGRGDIAFMMALRKAAKSIRSRKGRNGRAVIHPQSVECKITPGALEALQFWAWFFPRWDRICPIVQGFGPSASWQWRGQVDASTDWGCGGVLFSRDPSAPLLAFCHKWSQEERASAFIDTALSTGVLEMRGVVLWLQQFAHKCAKSRLLLEVDADAVMLALARCYSDSVPMLGGIRTARRQMAKFFICLRVTSITGHVFNLLADHLSHNRVREARCLAQDVFQRELVMVSPRR